MLEQLRWIQSIALETLKATIIVKEREAEVVVALDLIVALISYSRPWETILILGKFPMAREGEVAVNLPPSSLPAI